MPDRDDDGAYAQITSTGDERFSNGAKLNTDGAMTLVSIGPSVKARFALAANVTAKVGVFVGCNS